MSTFELAIYLSSLHFFREIKLYKVHDDTVIEVVGKALKQDMLDTNVNNIRVTLDFVIFLLLSFLIS